MALNLQNFRNKIQAASSGDVKIARLKTGYADLTQKLMSWLPSWHVGRRQRDSLVSVIANAVGGEPLTPLETYEVDNLASQVHASVANSSILSDAFSIDVSDTPKDSGRVYNRLRNSNFCEWTNPSRMPDFWTVDSEDFKNEMTLVQMVNSMAYLGGYAMSCTGNRSEYLPFGTITVAQRYVIPAGLEARDWKAFVYNIRLGETPLTNDYFQLYIKATLDDDTIEEVVAGVKDSTQWKKTTVKITIPRRAVTIDVGIKFEPMLNTPAFLSLFDCFFLAPSHEALFWSHHPDDHPSFTEKSQDGYCVISTGVGAMKKHRLVEISENELDRRLLPLSMEYIPSSTADKQIPSSTPIPIILPPAYDFNGDTINCGLVVVTEPTRRYYDWPLWTLGRLVKYELNNPAELIGTYIPAFPVVSTTNTGSPIMEALSSINMQAITLRDGYLWVVGKLLQGSSMRNAYFFRGIIFVIDMNLPKQGNSAEETGVDFEKNPLFIPVIRTFLFDKSEGIGFGAIPFGNEPFGGEDAFMGTSASSVSFVGPTRMNITAEDGSIARVDLRYDYFTASPGEARVTIFQDPNLNLASRNIVVC